MAQRVHHATARKLATKAEWSVLESSFGAALTDLTAARLAQRITRAKTMRDKHPRSSERRAMFVQALERFAAQRAKLERTSDAKRKRSPKKRSVMLAEPPVSVAAPENPWAAFDPATSIAQNMHSEASRGARKDQKLRHQSAIAHQAHVGSRGRRNQAKRDTR